LRSRVIVYRNSANVLEHSLESLFQNDVAIVHTCTCGSETLAGGCAKLAYLLTRRCQACVTGTPRLAGEKFLRTRCHHFHRAIVITTPDIAPPTEKPIKEPDRLIRVRDPLPAVCWVNADVSTVPDREPPISFRDNLGLRKFTYSSTRRSHVVFPGYSRCTASVGAGRHSGSRRRSSSVLEVAGLHCQRKSSGSSSSSE
jgi:hypothetical protein